MDKLRMQSTNGVQENIEKIQSLFPDCVTETIDERTGKLVRKVDFEKLQQNLYIEGDNLDVLKCLKETYLHKVKIR